MPKIDLKCACGNIQGYAELINSNSGTRISCCCGDCQEFAKVLGKTDCVLDQYEGTDIFQMPISHFKISKGDEQIACLRLSPKGLYRWYAKCCNTPIGNTMGPSAPFIGVIHSFMDHTSTRDIDLGKSLGYIQTELVEQKIPKDQQGWDFGINLKCLFKILIWKIRGFNKPSVFFTKDGNPIVEPSFPKFENTNG